MKKLTATESRELELDPKRSWARVECPNGHEAVVERHDGGSAAVCDQCTARFTYGGFVEPTVTPEPDAGVDRHVVDGDSAATGDERV